MSRDLSAVLFAIEAAIPDEGVRKRASAEFAKVLESLPFTSPELMPQRWREVADILESVVGPPTAADDWRREVGRIFAGDSTSIPKIMEILGGAEVMRQIDSDLLEWFSSTPYAGDLQCDESEPTGSRWICRCFKKTSEDSNPNLFLSITGRGTTAAEAIRRVKSAMLAMEGLF